MKKILLLAALLAAAFTARAQVDLDKEIFSLPMYPSLTNDEVSRIIETIKA